jgi:ribosome-binding ATPase YchF (GTP1/OBG family)
LEPIVLVCHPRFGKSSWFNALTGALVAPHRFTTTEPTVDVAHVPEGRIPRLAATCASKKPLYAGVEISGIGCVVASTEPTRVR